MRIGFLVWNQFQVAHSVEIAKHFDEPDFIFIDRDTNGLNGFNPGWLVPFGGYSRFVSETDLHSLDGQYDAIVTQFRPPLKTPWKKSKLVIHQYSLAKPKTAYNARWFTADRALVYGAYSAAIIGQMCPVSQIGNPRFDPLFEHRLDEGLLRSIRRHLDPEKKTIVYLPTWGDLNSSHSYVAALQRLSGEFNVIVRPHHLSALREAPEADPLAGLIRADAFAPMLDVGPYLLDLADLVISDMSGAIFDALYCSKPVVLLGGHGVTFDAHAKADESAIEIAQRDRIGPYVDCADDLRRAVYGMMERNPYQRRNEILVGECFKQRGGCSVLAAAAIREAVEQVPQRPPLQLYAAPNFSDNLLSRAAAAAGKRKRQRQGQPQILRHGLQTGEGKEPQPAPKSGGAATFALLTRWALRLLPERAVSGINRRARAVSRAASMREMFKRGHFFEAGYGLERWAKRPQRERARKLYQAQSMVTAIRFSRWKWKNNLAALFRGIYAPSTSAGKELLQSMGMLKTAQACYEKQSQNVPAELVSRLQTMGAIAGVLDVAARNEVSSDEWQLCVSANGEVVPLGAVPERQVVELFLLSSLSRDLRDESSRPYRSSQLEFSQSLVEQLLALGFLVYPRLQAGIVGATSVSISRPAFTWHTLFTGRKAHFHVKLGTLFGYFIVDGKGYSGWSSIADRDLQSLIAGVDQTEADAHWQKLYEDLVSGAKSKYAQSDDEVPEGWSEYVFLPMQVVDDTVADLSDIDTLSLLKALLFWAEDRHARLVVKRHPMCRSDEVAVALDQAAASQYVHITSGNIHRLVSGARCVVTVNSGVGAESLLQLKPVVTTGGSDYAAATHRVRTTEDLYRFLDSDVGLPAREEDIRRFLWLYTKRYMVHCRDSVALQQRLASLLLEAGFPCARSLAAPSSRAALPCPDGVTSIPFVTTASVMVDDDVVALDNVALGEACDELLQDLYERGARCWLDSGSLLGLVRYGHLNKWEKDIDLGIWIDDFEMAKAACQKLADKHSLWFRVKFARNVPYALLLSDHLGQPRSTLPISIHLFYRISDSAWLPQPYSLVSSRARYPRFMYREANGEVAASLQHKLGFLVSHPVHSLCIAMEKMNFTRRIGRVLKQIDKPRSLKEKFLTAVFVRIFQWDIPARYFEHLRPLSDRYPYIFMPDAVEEYLSLRYGDWHVPVKDWFYLIDDECIGDTDKKILDARLSSAERQIAHAMRSRG